MMIITHPAAFAFFVIAALLAIIEGSDVGLSIAGLSIGLALTTIELRGTRY